MKRCTHDRGIVISGNAKREEVEKWLADRANRLPDRGKWLPVTQADGTLTVALPDQAPDPIASVLCLETDAGVW